MNSLPKAGCLSFRVLEIAATNPRRLSDVHGTALSVSRMCWTTLAFATKP
jgi:hypothetical protein